MNPRREAIQILQQARDLLVDRLTDRVRESRDQILEDASGFCYLSEIEAIYEQLGGRLAHLNAMLTNLPPAEDLPVDEPHPAPAFTDVAAAYASTINIDALPPVEPLALPSPGAAERLPALPPPVSSFQTFLQQIEAGDLEAAGRTLTELFAVDARRGRRCADAFAAQWITHPDMLAKITRLRSELESGNSHSALTLLCECFDLHGLESLGVLQTLRARFNSPDAHAA
jgi:hypothetical protein